MPIWAFEKNSFAMYIPSVFKIYEPIFHYSVNAASFLSDGRQIFRINFFGAGGR